MEFCIEIDNVEYDPYFIMGVTPDDTVDHINKTFRKKAKILHPDKLTPKEKKDIKIVKERTKHFKILVECYEYVLNNKKRYTSSKHGENKFNKNLINNFDNNSDKLNSFNKEFESLKINQKTPNDFGYEIKEKIKTLEDYENFNEKPYKLFTKGSFNSNEFNNVFEYIKDSHSKKEKKNKALIHKTTDGFYGYNSGNLNNCSSVSTYNGMLIIGDNFGKNGVGYNGNNYSDYKQTYENAKNPNKKIQVPKEFITKKIKEKEMLENYKKPIKRQNIRINSTSRPSKIEFLNQNQEFNKKLEKQIEKEKQKEKEFVMQYSHLYKDHHFIQN